MTLFPGSKIRSRSLRPRRPGRLTAQVGVYLGYLGLVAVYTWPLVADPGRLLPPNGDPRLFSWVLVTMFRNLTTRPDLLFHGNAFYPFGNTLSLAEPLLVQTLVAGPLHAWTGNPILAYNLTLLLFWALSGWAMYWVALRVTASPVAAAIAGIVFTLAPYRMDHYMEFQMEMAFGIPLAIFGLVRFVETRRARHLGLLLAAFWLQAASVWYYAIILAIGLAVMGIQLLALRWEAWRPRTVGMAAAGALALGLALVPLAGPYFLTRRELGLERGMAEAIPRSANLGTFLEARPNWLYQVFTTPREWEASLFLGVGALALVAAACTWLARPGPARGRPERWLLAGAGALAAALAATLAGGGRLRLGGIELAPFTEISVALLAIGLVRRAVEGWRRWHGRVAPRALTEREWVLALLGLGATAVVLSLGPVVALRSFGRGPIDEGLYAWLWPHVVLFRAIRGPTRIGILAVFAGALLAGLGVKRLLVSPTGGRRALVAGLALVILLEYAWMPLPYRVEQSAGRPVDAVIGTDPADVAVVEWPLNVEMSDVDAMFRSLAHGKRVVNGLSGFVPTFVRDLSRVLTEPGPPFPTAAGEAALRRIYPLRYLVVRHADEHTVVREWQARWDELRESPPALLRHRGTFSETDLYEIVPLPERGPTVERWVSYDFLVRHPVLEAVVRPLVHASDRLPWVEVNLNGRPLVRVPLAREATPVRLRLEPPFLQVAPNVIRFTYGYDRVGSPLPLAAIGTTGAASPVDLVVTSAGWPHGNGASILVNGAERAPNLRGYNVVALGPDGRLLDVEVFDSFSGPAGADALAEWIEALEPGTVVAGAVKDDASGHLTPDAIDALRRLGVATDLRRRYRDSHAFVGVVGAAPGTAVEASGPRPLSVIVGAGGSGKAGPDGPAGLELTGFTLLPAGPDG